MARLFSLLVLLVTAEGSPAQQECHEVPGPLAGGVVERTTLLDGWLSGFAVAQDGRVFVGAGTSVYFIGQDGIYHTAQTASRVVQMGLYDAPFLHDGEFLWVAGSRSISIFDPQGSLLYSEHRDGHLGVPAAIDSTLVFPGVGLHFARLGRISLGMKLLSANSFDTDVVFRAKPLVVETAAGD